MNLSGLLKAQMRGGLTVQVLLPAKPDRRQSPAGMRASTGGFHGHQPAQGKASPPHDLLSNDAALADLVLLHLQAVLAHMQAAAIDSILESDLPQQWEIWLSHGPSTCLDLHGKLLILLTASFLDGAECCPKG